MRAASCRPGPAVSTPTSDHVPLATNAVAGGGAGTPTTAEAVSWDATVVTGIVGGRPVRAAILGRGTPRWAPGGAMGGSRPGEVRSRSRSTVDQSRVCTSTRPVVVALVYSVLRTPVSQN